MQRWGFLPNQIKSALRKLTNKRLIETTERVRFEEDLVGLIGDLPDGFRPTSIGVYHLRRWAGKFAYLDAMVFDTPIFEQDIREVIAVHLGSFDIADRYERTLEFRKYLSKVWEASNLRPEYFDWNEAVSDGQLEFNIVSAAIQKIASGRTTKSVQRSTRR